MGRPMKTQLHALVSIPITLILVLYSVDLAIWFCLASVLVDGDHVVSYWLSYEVVDFKFKKIYKAFATFNPDERKKIKYVMPLHAYELVLALSILTILFDYPMYLLGILSGLTLHLLIDFVTLRPILFGGKAMTTFKFYFFTYRLLQNFRFEKLFVFPIPLK